MSRLTRGARGPRALAALLALTACGGARTPDRAATVERVTPVASPGQAPRGTSVLDVSGAWTSEAPFVGAVLPWMPGISIRPCEIVDFDGGYEVVRVRALTYDEAGRLIAVRVTEGSATPGPDVFCLPDGWTDVTVRYDDAGALACVGRAGEEELATCFERDASGVTRWSDHEGTSATVVRDAAGRVAAIQGSFWSGEGIEEWAMRYDRVNRLHEQTVRTEANAGPDEMTHRYAYDERGNLAELTTTSRSSFVAGGGALRILTQRTLFRYDDAGRLASCERDGASVTYEYDARDRLTARVAVAGDGQALAQTVFAYECDAPAPDAGTAGAAPGPEPAAPPAATRPSPAP